MDKDTEFISTQVLSALMACSEWAEHAKAQRGEPQFCFGGGRVHGSSDKLGLEGCQLLGRLGETSEGLAWLSWGMGKVDGTKGREVTKWGGDQIMKSLNNT